MWKWKEPKTTYLAGMLIVNLD